MDDQRTDQRIRILVVDDHKLFRRRVDRTLRAITPLPSETP